MKKLLLLFHLDYLVIKDWFSKYTLTKISVFFGFLILICLVWLGLYLLSLNFFYYLHGYENFGQLTSDYIIHANFITISWLGLGTSLIAHLRWLAYSGFNSKILPLPIPAWVLVVHHNIKSFTLSFLVLVYFVSPFFYTYSLIFLPALNDLFWTHIGIILFITTLLIQAASLIALNLIKKFVIRQSQVPMITFLVILFLFSAFLILKLVLPSNLRLLYQSQTDEFVNVYQSLPLNQSYVPSKWMIDSVTNQFDPIKIGSLGVVGILIYILSNFLLSRKFVSIVQNTYQSNHSRHHISSHVKFEKFPLIKIWWISFLRNHSEIGYAGFLLLLSTVFFGIISQAQNLRQLESLYYEELFVFILGWGLLGATAFSLRFTFPIMSQLKLFSWKLATVPVTRTQLWQSVLVTGILISTPLLLIHTLSWSLIPLPSNYLILGLGLSLWGMLIIIISNTILGCVNPYFNESQNLEMATMTGMGLVALIWNLIIMASVSFLGWQFLNKTTEILQIILYLFLLSLIPLLIFSPLSRFRLKNLEL